MVTGFAGFSAHFFEKTLFTFIKFFSRFIRIGGKKWAFDQNPKTDSGSIA